MDTVGTRRAAEILGVSPRYVRVLVELGRLTPRPGDGHHRLDPREVERLAQERARCRQRPS